MLKINTRPAKSCFRFLPQNHQFDRQAQVQYVGSSEQQVVQRRAVAHAVRFAHALSVLRAAVTPEQTLPVLKGSLARAGPPARRLLPGSASRPLHAAAAAAAVLLARGEDQSGELPRNMSGKVDALGLAQSGQHALLGGVGPGERVTAQLLPQPQSFLLGRGQRAPQPAAHHGGRQARGPDHGRYRAAVGAKQRAAATGVRLWDERTGSTLDWIPFNVIVNAQCTSTEQRNAVGIQTEVLSSELNTVYTH